MQSDSPAAPAPQLARRNWFNFIIDHNPCYLLSGLFMLAGCWLLNFALYTKAGDIRKLLLLLLIVNIYEFLLITLGLALIKRIAFKRDGRILLALEALFLIDITFTSGILSTIDLSIGLLINATLYGNPPIVVAAEQRDRHLRIAVEDHGPGVPEDLRPHLFERFTRGDAARGTGLGLAIARAYARAHGGDLLYEPRERGARFELIVPQG